MKLYYKDDYCTVTQGDCLEVMAKTAERGLKFDAVITDPPYGTTACKWDVIIPFDKMWNYLNDLIKENTPVVLFGNEPFSSFLRCSNIKDYRYDWIWDKKHGANFAQANKRPLKNIENISVFYNKPCLYNPQKILNPKGEEKRSKYAPSKQKECFVDQVAMNNEYAHFGDKYESDKLLPKSIISFSRDASPIHPTQKPVNLMEYLILTYTNEGDTILDFTCGSGTTLVAAKRLKRKCYGIELEEKYCEITKNRLLEVT